MHQQIQMSSWVGASVKYIQVMSHMIIHKFLNKNGFLH